MNRSCNILHFFAAVRLLFYCLIDYKCGKNTNYTYYRYEKSIVCKIHTVPLYYSLLLGFKFKKYIICYKQSLLSADRYLILLLQHQPLYLKIHHKGQLLQAYIYLKHSLQHLLYYLCLFPF